MGAVGKREELNVSAPSDDSLLKVVEQIRRKVPFFEELMTAADEAAFQSALEAHLDHCIRRLEDDARVLAKLDEEGLSAVLAQSLTFPGLAATRETYANGHVDITITLEHSRPVRRVLAEAKVWGGPAYHFKGLEQLIGRYSTGRDSGGLVIAYVTQPDIAKKIADLLGRLNYEKPCGQQGSATKLAFKWSLRSEHKHSSGETLRVGHFACNLHVNK